MIMIGDRLPAMIFKHLDENKMQDLPLERLYAHKKIVIFAVPGAFTPTCSSVHAPGFLAHLADFKKKGIDQVICLSVNDPFVMKAWADSLQADHQVLFLADGNGDFTETIGMVLDARAHGLGLRSKRYALMAEDGVVQALAVEENAGVCAVSDAASFLKTI